MPVINSSPTIADKIPITIITPPNAQNTYLTNVKPRIDTAKIAAAKNKWYKIKPKGPLNNLLILSPLF